MSGVDVRLDGAVAWVTLANAERANALTAAMLRQLTEAWQTVEATPSVGAAVLTADGTRHFCAGADRDDLGTEVFRQASEGAFTPRRAGLSKPVVAAVNGTAAGGGLSLVADSDVVIAVEETVFVDLHRHAGVTGNSTARALRSRLPAGEALLLAAGGRESAMTAARAHQLGFVQEVVQGTDALRARAGAVASWLAQLPPSTVDALRGPAAPGREVPWTS